MKEMRAEGREPREKSICFFLFLSVSLSLYERRVIEYDGAVYGGLVLKTPYEVNCLESPHISPIRLKHTKVKSLIPSILLSHHL